MFWAAGGDGLSIYQLSKAGQATLQLTIDPTNDRPGDCKLASGCAALINGLAYDRADDTIWYSPDASLRIYHYETFADSSGTAVLASTPFVDIDVSPNDMAAQCAPAAFNNSSGVAVGGEHLFLTSGGCAFYFQ